MNGSGYPVALQSASAAPALRKREVIAVANEKGGVGKTTVAANLAVAFAAKGLRVLAIDSDATAALSWQLGVSVPVPRAGTLAGAYETGSLDGSIVKAHGRIDAVAGHPDLILVERLLATKRRSESRLGLLLREAEYDVVVVDSPGSRGELMANCLAAATAVVVPVVPGDPVGAQTIPAVLDELDELDHHPLVGLVRNRHHPRRLLDAAVMDQLDRLSMPIWGPPVTEVESIRQAVARRVPIVLARPDSLPATQLRGVAHDLLEALHARR